MDRITAGRKDVLAAAGIAPWDIRYNAAVGRTTRALEALDARAAATVGPVLADRMWAGFFKLSAREPHRLTKLVDSVIALRAEAVVRALLAYDDEN